MRTSLGIQQHLVANRRERRVPPESFQIVEFPRGLLKNMGDHVHIIDQNPPVGFLSLPVMGSDVLFGQLIDDVIGNRARMQIARGGTDDKTVGDTGQSIQVGDHDVFRFLLQHQLSDAIGELLCLRDADAFGGFLCNRTRFGRFLSRRDRFLCSRPDGLGGLGFLCGSLGCGFLRRLPGGFRANRLLRSR